MKARILDPQVKVYSSTDANAVTFTSLPVGSEIEIANAIKKAGKQWLPITLPTGQKAYIPGETRIYQIPEGYTMQKDVELHAEPSSKSPIKFTLRRGTTLSLMQVVREDGRDWVRVQDKNGTEGYIAGDTRIRKIPPRTKANFRKKLAEALWAIAGLVVSIAGTGDFANLLPWVGLLFAVALLIAGIVLYMSTPDGKPTRNFGKLLKPALFILTGFLTTIFIIGRASIEAVTTAGVLFLLSTSVLVTRMVMGRYREKRMYSIKYRRPNSYATDQLSLTLSVSKLGDTSPEVVGFKGLRNRIRWKLNGKWNFIDVLKEHIYYGDSQPSIVMKVDPLLIAVYSIDLDCVAILQFPVKLVKKYNLQLKSQLISINTYMKSDKYQSDLTPGLKETGDWTGFFPVIADFITDDTVTIERRKKSIEQQHWEYVYRLGIDYIQSYPMISRDGNPFNSWRVLQDSKSVPNNNLMGPNAPQLSKM